MRYSRWLGLLAVLFLLAAGLSAQVAGRLSGSVVDQSGAPVPGATVNVYVAGGKEPLLTGNTNQEGLFLFSTVRPGTYDVGIEAQGFGKAMVRQAEVSALQEKNLGEVKLEVQTVTESVEVTTDTVAINTTDAELSKTITNQQIQNLPLSGRQISNLFSTIPGVSSGSNTTAVNGLHSSFSNVTLDGVNIQDNFIRTNALDYAPMRTTMDQVAEVTVSTTNQLAAIGGGSSQFTMVTRSGTNSYHGAVYWFNRNSALAANDWFNNRDGAGKSKVNLNQPGVALGGPVLKDKLFFYSNYEWYRNKSTSSQTRTVLTNSAKQGLFTYGAGQVNLHSLRSFTDDPTVKAMIAALPAPNAPGGDGLNTSGYRFNALSDEFRDQFVFRGDYYLSTKHNFSGTYDYIDNPTKRPDVTANFYTTVPPVNNTITDHLMALSWRWMVSPTLTNELRGGFLRAATGFLDVDKYPTPIVGGTIFTSPVNNFLNQGRNVNTYNVQDNATWIRGRHQFTFGYQGQFLHVSPWNDGGIIPTYNLGISTANTNGLTVAELPGSTSTERTRANNLYATLAGIISSASQTFNVTSTTSGFVNGATNLRQLQYSTHAGYFQDTWKVRPNLTLNLGVRYEYWQPLDEKNSLFLAPVIQNGNIQSSLLDPNLTLNFIGKSSGRPFYNADKNNFAPNIGFAWRPWEHDSLTIRGGYMASYVNDNVVTAVRSAVSASSGLSFAGSLSNQVALLASPPPVPAPTYKVPRSLADNFALSVATTTAIPDPNLQAPIVHQFNLSVEREVKGIVLAARFVGNRSHGLLRQIDYNQILYNANGFLADFQRAQGNAVLAQAAGKGYDGSYNPAIPGSQQLTVFPLLVNGGSLATSATVQTYLQNGQIADLANSYMTGKTNGSVNFWPNKNAQSVFFLKNGASGTYNSMQLEMTKRTRTGLVAQFSYTLAKSMSNIAGDRQTDQEPLLDNGNPQLEWARSPYDINHVLKANYSYELPFGKGKRFAAGNAIANQIIGGWTLGGIWNYQSGSPYSILSGWGTLNRSAISAYANTASVLGTTSSQLKSLTSGVWKTGDNVFFLSPSLIGPDGTGASAPGTAPFQGQLFYNPVAGSVGNTQRRMFSGPWEWSWDISVVKNFHITERHLLEFHLNMLNFANHPTFYVYPTSNGDYAYNSYNTINNTTFGTIDSMQYSPRVIEMGLYYKF